MPKQIYETKETVYGYEAGIMHADQLDKAELVPLFADNGLGNNEAVTIARGVRNSRTGTVIATVGGRYAAVQHGDLLKHVLNTLHNAGIQIGEIEVMQSDARAHIHVRFAEEVQVGEDAQEGDYVNFGVMLVNSYDGTTPIKGGLCGLRLMCTNGMVSTTRDLVSVRKKHTTGDVAELFGAGIVDFVKGVGAEISGWAGSIQAAQAEELESWEVDLILAGSGFGDRHQQRIWDRLMTEQAEEYKQRNQTTRMRLDRWELYNAATGVITHELNSSTQAKERLYALANQLLTAVVPEVSDLVPEGEDFEFRLWTDDAADFKAKSDDEADEQ